MDLVTIGFSFGLGVLIGNNKTRHKLQEIIQNLNKPEKKKDEKQTKLEVKN